MFILTSNPVAFELSSTFPENGLYFSVESSFFFFFFSSKAQEKKLGKMYTKEDLKTEGKKKNLILLDLKIRES